MALSDFRVVVNGYTIGTATPATIGVQTGVTNVTGADGFTSKSRAVDYQGAAGAYVPPTLQAPRLIGIEFNIRKGGDPVAVRQEFQICASAVNVAAGATFIVNFGPFGYTVDYTCREPNLIEDYSLLHRGLIRARLTVLAGDPNPL